MRAAAHLGWAATTRSHPCRTTRSNARTSRPAADPWSRTARRVTLPGSAPRCSFWGGIVIGTLVMAATRPMHESGWPSITNDATTGNPSCDRVVTESQHLADLTARTANAAQHQDATSLGELGRELDTSQNTLHIDATGCHH